MAISAPLCELQRYHKYAFSFFLQYVSEDRISKKLNLAFSRSFGPTYEAPGGGMVINITINISLIQEMLPTKNDNN